MRFEISAMEELADSLRTYVEREFRFMLGRNGHRVECVQVVILDEIYSDDGSLLR